jgi:predicted DNA-binding transcriptional regulator AlpA
MDFARILERLTGCNELLTKVQLAKLFEVHRRTIEQHWIPSYAFPTHIKLHEGMRTARLFWRPDQVAEWVRERQRIAERGIDIDAICALVGVNRSTWYEWIKAKRAPAPAWRALGTGRDLWDREEVLAWLNARTGGYALPPALQGKARTKKNALDETVRGPRTAAERRA